MKNREVKKNLMYISGEDFYLFSYSMFIVLDSLDCHGNRSFKDYRKLAFLIEFIKDEKLNYILSNSPDGPLNPIDKEYLFHSYSVGLGRRSETLKILFTLEKQKLVILEKGKKGSLVNVALNRHAFPDGFFDKEVFAKEYQNMTSFKVAIKRLSALNLETMLDRVYRNKGLSLWAI